MPGRSAANFGQVADVWPRAASHAESVATKPKQARAAAAAGSRFMAGAGAEGFSMRQIRISKRKRATDQHLEPIPRDLRDPDVVRAKQYARHPRPAVHRQREAG